MPVKVRCSECERVVNAPDRARGKAVKCPQCGKAIRVPAEKAAPAAKKAAARPPSSSMIIANLDLDRLEDEQTRICPKCGAEVSAEATECPECQVNLLTGLLSREVQADRDRKGPDPKKYYQEFFSDSLEFWRKNKKRRRIESRSSMIGSPPLLLRTQNINNCNWRRVNLFVFVRNWTRDLVTMTKSGVRLSGYYRPQMLA